MLAEGEGIAGAPGELHPDGLGLGVLVDGLDAVLPAEPAGPEPAEGDVRADHPVGVDPDGPGPQRVRYPVTAVYVLGPHRAGQAVAGVVGQADGLLLGVE